MTILHASYAVASIYDLFFTTPCVRLIWKNAGVALAKGSRFWGLPILNKAEGSSIFIGENFQARSRSSSNSVGTIQPLVITTYSSSANLRLGNNVAVSGCTIHCRERIELGDHVGLGSGCFIMDNDGHPLNHLERSAERQNIRSSPVVLEEYVWIGGRAIVLKGTHIGARSIVQAGSVVSGEFPSDCIIAGNPAVIVNRKKG